MKRVLVSIPLMILLGGCWPFGGQAPLPDKRTQIPGSEEVNNYLDQATRAESVHCIEDGDGSSTKPQTHFHDGHAKISTNLVGRDVSHQWDESWNGMIGETLEDKFPELISEDFKMHEGELAQLGCGGFLLASKEDKKRFWALFLATLARVQSGFDPSFKEKSSTGLFGLNPAKMNSLGGECGGKDQFDFMEPSYSFGCALEGIKAQMSSTGKIFSETPKGLVPFPNLTGPARFNFIKFFKAHAAPQFSFCSSGVNAPTELVTANSEGEKSTSECSPERLRRINESLDRSELKGKAGTSVEGGLDKGSSAPSEVSGDVSGSGSELPESGTSDSISK